MDDALNGLVDALDAIASHPSDNFVELAHAAGLDPATDFVGVDLRDVDLSGCKLTGFNLTRCDLRGAFFDPETDFTGAVVDGARFEAGMWEVLRGLPRTPANDR